MGASERLYHSQGRECGLGGLPGKRSRDAFPVTPYHTLIIPKRHVLDYFGLKQPEINAINRLLTDQRAALQNADLTIDDFNVGMNCGETAGQSVFHCHVHLIPRSEAIWRDNIYRTRTYRYRELRGCLAIRKSAHSRMRSSVARARRLGKPTLGRRRALMRSTL